jgi:hypothetical protein
MNEKSLESIKPYEFKPGESGNPSGRPVGSVSIVTKLKRLMEQEFSDFDPTDNNKLTKKQIQEWIALKLVVQAMKGDMTAIKEALERIDGKVLQKLESTGKDGEPLIPNDQKITVEMVKQRIEDMLNKPNKE